MVQQRSRLSLSMMEPGQSVEVVDIRAGHNAARRLAEMGITRGAHLRTLQNNGGSLLVAMRDTRLALGRGIAHKIQVALESDAPSNQHHRSLCLHAE